MKHEMRPAQLVEADANITAFSDEYDLGECTSFSYAKHAALTPPLAHEGNGITHTPFTISIPYCNTRSCNPRGCPSCTEDEGTEGSSIEVTRAYVHGCLASVVLHPIPPDQDPRLSCCGKPCVPVRQPRRHGGGLSHIPGCQCPTSNATFHRQWSDP